MRDIRAVWCDFGGVLTPPIAEAFDRLVRAAGIPSEPLRASINRVAAEYGLAMLEPLELGLLPQGEWGQRVTADLAPSWTPGIDLSRFGDYWYAGRTINTALLDGLAELRHRGLRVGMLTNSVREWEPHRDAMMPAVTAFEVTINSFEVRLRKPDPAIYRMAQEAFGSEPGECLLIDDLPVNCDAAAGLGWQTIRHRTVPDTLARLAALTAGPR